MQQMPKKKILCLSLPAHNSDVCFVWSHQTLIYLFVETLIIMCVCAHTAFAEELVKVVELEGWRSQHKRLAIDGTLPSIEILIRINETPKHKNMGFDL